MIKLTWPFRWPWKRRGAAPVLDNGPVAAAALATSQARRRAAERDWPAVHAARDELARVAERAMRGQRA
jgi:hypothetical protein